MPASTFYHKSRKRNADMIVYVPISKSFYEAFAVYPMAAAFYVAAHFQVIILIDFRSSMIFASWRQRLNNNLFNLIQENQEDNFILQDLLLLSLTILSGVPLLLHVYWIGRVQVPYAPNFRESTLSIYLKGSEPFGKSSHPLIMEIVSCGISTVWGKQNCVDPHKSLFSQ